MDNNGTELAKAYEPQEVEKGIYDWWDEQGFFRPEKQRELGLVDDQSERYCLTLPPPNVTGQLHLGHAITIAIEDLMVRYERMRQKETLFLPGSDHAGIATQNVVERELLKKGIKRKDLGRDRFVEEVWNWKDEYHARITNQSKGMGMSCDWTRERFTLDDDLSKAVRTAFVTLFKKGLIYRGQYLVNWCPGRCESAISDLEAEPQEVESSLWFIKYPIIGEGWKGPKTEWGSGEWAKGATEFIEVATTRPETLLGDTAVATTEEHPIFGPLVGKTAVLPGNNRHIPVLTDPHVDPQFGTGAVKVTPAHDPNDYEIGHRHQLEFITVMDEKGQMVAEYSGMYAGMDRFECRKSIVEDLRKEGLLVKIEPHTHSEPHCQRCHTIVEPRISTQWFVKTQRLAQAAVDRVRSGETVIIPEREEKRFYQWMENIRDWCISRQLWWGHRIPVWYCPDGHVISELDDPTICPECGSSELVQDEDVLDTWFSSGLWPFSTLGWPEETADLKRFYPTDMRETGYDILFFWVAREMMMGVELTGKAPYKFIYLHGIVRDEHSKKISKSMENVDQYDPLKIIAEYGADSLRYTLASNSVPGLDTNLDPRRLEASRRFCNKIWQSTKFVLGNLGEGDVPRFDGSSLDGKLQNADRWILSKLNCLIKDVNVYMEAHDYLQAGREIKNFYWSVFCDWYLETTKPRIYGDSQADKKTPRVILLHVLDTCLRLLHPFMPYITEKLWQVLPNSVHDTPALVVAKWPTHDESFINHQIEQEFVSAMDLIKAVRRARKDFNVPAKAETALVVETDSTVVFENTRSEVANLAQVDPKRLEIVTNAVPPRRAARLVLHGFTAYLPLEDLINVEAEKDRISKQLGKVIKQTSGLEKKLAGPFAERAKPEVVDREREKLAELQERKGQLEEQLATLS